MTLLNDEHIELIHDWTQHSWVGDRIINDTKYKPQDMSLYSYVLMCSARIMDKNHRCTPHRIEVIGMASYYDIIMNNYIRSMTRLVTKSFYRVARMAYKIDISKTKLIMSLNGHMDVYARDLHRKSRAQFKQMIIQLLSSRLCTDLALHVWKFVL